MKEYSSRLSKQKQEKTVKFAAELPLLDLNKSYDYGQSMRVFHLRSTRGEKEPNYES